MAQFRPQFTGPAMAYWSCTYMNNQQIIEFIRIYLISVTGVYINAHSSQKQPENVDEILQTKA